VGVLGVEKFVGCPRWMIRPHLPAVLAIERSTFRDPWTQEDFLRVVADPLGRAQVVERHGQVVAYSVYRLGEQNVELLNIAVAPYWRRLGLGSLLFGRLVEKVGHGRYRYGKIRLTVPDNLLGAHLFFRAHGLRCRSTVRSLYGDGVDGYLFEKGAGDEVNYCG
jgi:[ribosomal protein S18]-alanine N-acetyltransferase